MDQACASCAAGLTNTLWMRPGGVVIQMFPYGYEQEPGKLYRSYLYEQLAHNMNCTMLFWQNQRAEHAYLLGREPGQEHPAEGEIAERKQWDASGELHRQWFYQVGSRPPGLGADHLPCVSSL